VANEHDVLLLPFFMQGVALVEGMMQDDGIHPSAEAQPVLLDNVWAVLEPALSAPAAADTPPGPAAAGSGID
jgi:acyl-CoA thioesterase-1